MLAKGQYSSSGRANGHWRVAYCSGKPRFEADFDEGLVKAVIQYQIRNGLEPDGHAGGKTLEALNTPIAVRIEQIRANMERWRHMPEDFPPQRYTLVNIADASIVIVEDGKPLGPMVSV